MNKVSTHCSQEKKACHVSLGILAHALLSNIPRYYLVKMDRPRYIPLTSTICKKSDTDTQGMPKIRKNI